MERQIVIKNIPDELWQMLYDASTKAGKEDCDNIVIDMKSVQDTRVYDGLTNNADLTAMPYMDRRYLELLMLRVKQMLEAQDQYLKHKGNVNLRYAKATEGAVRKAIKLLRKRGYNYYNDNRATKQRIAFPETKDMGGVGAQPVQGDTRPIGDGELPGGY